MSADLLREAAALMRDRAEAFRDDAEFVNRWEAKPTIDPENTGWVVAHDWAADYDSTVAHLPYDYEGQVAEHIASWHPAVALAVADWLDKQAEMSEGMPGFDIEGMGDASGLAVARAYLGRQP